MKKSVLDYGLRVRLPITILVILISYAITFYVSRSERDGVGYKPDQPINFSHKLHAGEMGIDCQYCHVGVEKSRHAVVPQASTCMNCHTMAKTDSPEIKKLTKYYESGEAIPWKRVHQVPEYAYFNHSAHINANIECASCHGDVASMDKIEQVHAFNMANCLSCHRAPHEKMPYLADKVKKGPEDCSSCHR